MHVIVSRRYDWGWFVGPGVLALAATPWLARDSANETRALWLWIVGVLLVDVAHVWATLYRTYADPQARQLHRTMLRGLPVACFAGAFALHLISPRLLWSVMAYIAVFHFIKQHQGFAAIYARGAGEPTYARRWSSAALWAGTLGPVLWWHARLPRDYSWFTPHDFHALPESLGTLALLAQLPIWVGWLASRARVRRTGTRNAIHEALVILPALTWHVGIVVYNDDRVFTITNVLLHGVPYFALTWCAGGRARVETLATGWRLPRQHLRKLAPLLFYLPLALLAFAEESLWDWLVWHERSGLFGDPGVRLPTVAVAAAVALLSVPQNTHYFLDRWIWRAGPKNPELAGQLGLGLQRTPPPRP